MNTDILDEENEEKVAAEEQSTIASAYDDDAGASVDVKDNGVDKIDEDALSEEEVVDDNGESRASDFVEYTTDIATDMNEDNTPLLRKVNDLLQVLLLRGRMSIHRKVSKVVTIVSQNKPQIAAVAAIVSLVVGGRIIFAASDDTQVTGQQEEMETLKLPDDLIEEDESHVEESDEDN